VGLSFTHRLSVWLTKRGGGRASAGSSLEFGGADADAIEPRFEAAKLNTFSSRSRFGCCGFSGSGSFSDSLSVDGVLLLEGVRIRFEVLLLAGPSGVDVVADTDCSMEGGPHQGSTNFLAL